MNTNIKVLFTLLLILLLQNNSKASDSLFVFPTYTLTVANITQTQANRIEFDIYLRHTNGNVTPFIYGSATYYWDFNSTIAFPGDTLKFSIIESDLPQEYRPVNPSITGNILRMAPNLPTSPEFSPIIDTANPGTLIAKMRLRTTGSSFTNQPLNLAWRSSLPNPFTKIAAFTGENNVLLYEIQNPNSNFIGSYLYSQLISPMLNSTDNYINLNFIWGKNSNTVNYHLQISTDSLFNSYFYTDSTLTDTSKYISGLALNSKYFWRVKTKDTTGNTYYSSTWNFRTLPTTIINLNLTALSQGKYNLNFNLLRQKDSVTVYLRSITAPFMVVDSAEGPIDTINFSNVFTFHTIESGNYYICVKNKQCVETWSKAGGEYMINSGVPVYYDFTTSSAQAYGSNQKLVGSKYSFYSGDINQDKFVSIEDLVPIFNDARVFTSGYKKLTDINGDNVVDINDANICYNNSINFVGTLQP